MPITMPAKCREMLTVRVEFASCSGKRFQTKYPKMTTIVMVRSREFQENFCMTWYKSTNWCRYRREVSTNITVTAVNSNRSGELLVVWYRSMYRAIIPADRARVHTSITPKKVRMLLPDVRSRYISQNRSSNPASAESIPERPA